MRWTRSNFTRDCHRRRRQVHPCLVISPGKPTFSLATHSYVSKVNHAYSKRFFFVPARIFWSGNFTHRSLYIYKFVYLQVKVCDIWLRQLWCILSLPSFSFASFLSRIIPFLLPEFQTSSPLIFFSRSPLIIIHIRKWNVVVILYQSCNFQSSRRLSTSLLWVFLTDYFTSKHIIEVRTWLFAYNSSRSSTSRAFCKCWLRGKHLPTNPLPPLPTPLHPSDWNAWPAEPYKRRVRVWMKKRESFVNGLKREGRKFVWRGCFSASLIPYSSQVYCCRWKLHHCFNIIPSNRRDYLIYCQGASGNFAGFKLAPVLRDFWARGRK